MPKGVARSIPYRLFTGRQSPDALHLPAGSHVSGISIFGERVQTSGVGLASGLFVPRKLRNMHANLSRIIRSSKIKKLAREFDVKVSALNANRFVLLIPEKYTSGAKRSHTLQEHPCPLNSSHSLW
jgi:hypothetical protein